MPQNRQEQESIPVFVPLALHHQPGIWMLGIALLTIGFDNWLQPAIWYWRIGFMIVVALLIGLRERLTLLTVFAFLVCTFGMWHAASQRSYREDHLARWMSTEWKPLILRGRIASQVDHRLNEMAMLRPGNVSPWQAMVEIEVTEIRIGSQWQPASGLTRLTVDDRLDDILHGDQVMVTCSGARPGPPTNPGEPDFRNAYSSTRQLVLLKAENAAHVRLETAGRWGIWRLTAWLARRGEHALQTCVGETYGPVASAIVLGRRSSVPEDMRENLVATGTVHLSSVSGLHVGIVAFAVSWIANAIGMRPRRRYMLIFFTCLLYALVTGFCPPVVRATALIGIMLIGQAVGRRADGLGLLAWATLMLLLVNPMWLSLIGTQLSVLAMVGMAISSDWINRKRPLDALDKLIVSTQSKWWRRTVRWWQTTTDGLKVSLCVWATTTPLIWYYFHVISWIAVIANLLVGPFLLVALLTGLLTAILGGLWTPLGMVTGWACDRSLFMIDWLATMLSEPAWTHVWLPSPPKAFVIGYYLAAFIALASTRRYRSPAVGAVTLVWALCVAIWVSQYSSRPERLTVTFIDVGHGTSVLIQPSDGLPWLYDAGRLGAPSTSLRPIESVLWEAGIHRLGGIVLSHADSDHYCAMPQLLRRFSVDRIVVPPGMFADAPPLLKETQLAIEEAKIPLIEVASGEPIPGLPAQWQSRIIHPPRVFPKSTDNARSIVWELQAEGLVLVLPGDLEPPGTDYVLREPRPPSNGVLMAPHHGSLSANPVSLIEWSRPEALVVSGGPRALRPEVAKRMQSVGCRTWITAGEGAIRVRRVNGELEIRGFVNDPW